MIEILITELKEMVRAKGIDYKEDEVRYTFQESLSHTQWKNENCHKVIIYYTSREKLLWILAHEVGHMEGSNQGVKCYLKNPLPAEHEASLWALWWLTAKGYDNLQEVKAFYNQHLDNYVTNYGLRRYKKYVLQ
jgi:hypothetical protein